MDGAIEALCAFRRRMDRLGVARYRAVATSAVRESENGAEFVRRAEEEAGVRVEPITGEDEAHLTWIAIRHGVPLGEREWVVADLGGGSLEISGVDAERIRWTDSFPLGTVRLLDELGDAGADDPARLRRLLAGNPLSVRLRAAAEEARGAGLIATGGNIEVLAGLVGARADESGVRRLPLSRLREILGRLAGMSARARMERFGLRADRADVIVPAAVVYEYVTEELGAAAIVVSGVGVREGVLLEVGAGS
jgi:exopolyphosphatase/guanosine-5'-triphosphate,3'-diphosphate pyrophosphatase